MCRHLGAGDQEGECWDEMMDSDEPSRTRDVSGARMGLFWDLSVSDGWNVCFLALGKEEVADEPIAAGKQSAAPVCLRIGMMYS